MKNIIDLGIENRILFYCIWEEKVGSEILLVLKKFSKCIIASKIIERFVKK